MMTHASLFSGIGGFDIAAEWAGWTNAFNCEIDPFCKQVLNYFFPNATQYGDIKTTDFTSWRGRIDVLSGGFPCQPFSLAGKRKGASDNRHLWPQMLRVISEIRPTWVIGENVGGILSMVEPGCDVDVEAQASLFGADYSQTVERQRFIIEGICRDLERIGYAVQPILIPACAVGAPHRRDRVWFIAEDTEYFRRNCRKSEEEPEAGRFGEFGAGDHVRVCGAEGVASHRPNARVEAMQRERQDRVLSDTLVAYAQCVGGREIHDQIQSRQPDGKVIDGIGDEWVVADTTRIGWEQGWTAGDGALQNKEIRTNLHVAAERSGGKQSIADTEIQRLSIAGRTRERRAGFEDNRCIPNWNNFPTQSPVCGGDDGISDLLDFDAVFAGIDKSRRVRAYPRWRTKAIKAYGNAIVPQVAFRIFQAINEVERIRR